MQCTIGIRIFNTNNVFLSSPSIARIKFLISYIFSYQYIFFIVLHTHCAQRSVISIGKNLCFEIGSHFIAESRSVREFLDFLTVSFVQIVVA